MKVPCGKCEACRMQKSSMQSLKCKLESLTHKHTFFVTLTYDAKHLPMMVAYSPDDMANRMKEKRHFYFFDVTNRTPEGEILSECDMSFHELSMLQKKCNLGEELPYLSVRDLQLFMKRLRKNLSFISDEKIRYYAVGEYGPVHFRPHFHLMLWFSDEKIAEVLSENLHKAWPFGRIDSQESQGKSASYVAGYLNGFSYLPSVFKAGKIKPFSVHSFFLGEKFLKNTKEEVYKMPVKDFVTRCVNLDGINSKFSMWRTFKTAYFPRCPRYAQLSHSLRLYSYLTYGAASEIFGKISPLLQAKRIVDLIKDNSPFGYPVIDYFRDVYFITPYIGQSQYEKMVRQVYLELRISKHFLEFVCDGIDNPLHLINCVRMIEHFYDSCERLNLSHQVKLEDDFLKNDSYTLEELNFLYDNKPFDLEMLKNSKIYKQFREEQLLKAYNSVKHKTLNDQNKIFCY